MAGSFQRPDPAPFTWKDGERLIVFGRGELARAPDLLPETYTLLTTPRAERSAAAVVQQAAAVHHVPSGRVDEIAAGLIGTGKGQNLVALGGGRVIDVAKAMAAAVGPPASVAAIPTTLSAAEMTQIHRHAAGADPGTPRVRPNLVLNDPLLSASQPLPELAASAANALGHAIEGPLSNLASPVPVYAGLAAGALIASAFEADEPDRDAVALGALLSGYAIDQAGYGLHHVMSQTLVREAGVGHGAANAMLLPFTTRALRARDPAGMERMDHAIGEDASSVAARLARLTGWIRLREVGVTAEQLAVCADAAAERAELHLTPPPADRTELLALYEEAW